MLEKSFNLIECPNNDETTIIEYVNKHNIQAIVVRLERMTRKIFENCKSLKVIVQHGVGVDHIDVNAATDHGVLILNVPDSNFTSVAEHTMMSILALSRNLLVSDQKVRNGHWNYRYEFMPMELSAKKLLIIGFGMIGQEVVKKAQAFNLNLFAFDPLVSKEAMNAFGVEKVNYLEDGLKMADFVSLHVPLTPKTKHLISTNELELMKKTAFLVNVARGSVVDEDALYEALKYNKIQGAALDVMEEEPPELNHKLFELDNIIFTPHLAGDTLEAKDRCAIFLAEDLMRTLQKQLPKNLVNLNVLKSNRLFNGT